MQPQINNDLDIANFALTLEHLEATFYKQVVASGKLQGKALQYLTVIRDHEVAHVAKLTTFIQQAGGTPVQAQAKYNFAAASPGADINTQAGILAIANVFEPIGVMAYDGAAPLIKDKATVLALAGQIVQVEARHAAIVKVLLDPNANPVPDAFAKSATPDQIFNLVKPVLGQ